MDIPEGRIRADRLNIEFNQVPLTSNEPQRFKLYNMAKLPQISNFGSLWIFHSVP